MGTRWVRAQPEIVAILRHELADELLADGVSPTIVDDAVLVVSELVGNSIRHARALPTGQLAVSWERRGGGLTISVTDGGGLQAPAVRDANPCDTGGRGLSIVAALTDFWGVSHGPDTVTVWAHVPAPMPAPLVPA